MWPQKPNGSKQNPARLIPGWADFQRLLTPLPGTDLITFPLLNVPGSGNQQVYPGHVQSP